MDGEHPSSVMVSSHSVEISARTRQGPRQECGAPKPGAVNQQASVKGSRDAPRVAASNCTKGRGGKGGSQTELPNAAKQRRSRVAGSRHCRSPLPAGAGRGRTAPAPRPEARGWGGGETWPAVGGSELGIRTSGPRWPVTIRCLITACRRAGRKSASQKPVQRMSVSENLPAEEGFPRPNGFSLWCIKVQSIALCRL